MIPNKGGGVLKFVGGLMNVAFGEAFMKGGRASLNMSFVVGEGTRIRFLHDMWISDNTIKNLYLELYVCSAAKGACIFEVLWIPKSC